MAAKRSAQPPGLIILPLSSVLHRITATYISFSGKTSNIVLFYPNLTLSVNSSPTILFFIFNIKEINFKKIAISSCVCVFVTCEYSFMMYDGAYWGKLCMQLPQEPLRFHGKHRACKIKIKKYLHHLYPSNLDKRLKIW